MFPPVATFKAELYVVTGIAFEVSSLGIYCEFFFSGTDFVISFI